MAQSFDHKPFDTKTGSIGGIRLLLRDTPDSGNGKGFKYVGNIHSPTFAAETEAYEHFSAASGANVKDWEVPVKSGYGFGFTADELLADNMRRFLLALAPTDVAADAVATYGPELFLAGKTGELHGLEFGRQTLAQRGDLKVYNVTDAALLVLDTDYEIITQFGLTFIRMLVDTHAGDVIRAGEGATASTAYHYNKLQHKLIAPMTSLKLNCAAIIQFAAKKGINAEWRIPKALIKPDGEFDWNPEQASSLKFALEALDDSVNNPSTPFGTVHYFGHDTAGAAII